MGPAGRPGTRAATGMFLSMRPPVPPLGATIITVTTAAMLAAVVAAVAGAALAPAVLPPAHAAAGEPGTLAFEFGSLGRDTGEFVSINDIAVGPNGRIVVSDGRDGIEVFHPNGTFAFKAKQPGNVHYYDGVDVGPDGDIVAVCVHHYVCGFHPNGTFNFRFLMDGYSYASVSDIAFGPGGRIVAGGSDSQIRVYHPNGTLDFMFGDVGADAGEFGADGVRAVDVGPGGIIAALNSGSRDVWLFHPNGTFAGEFKHGHYVYDIAFGPSGEVVLASWRGVHVYHPNGTSAFNITRAITDPVAVGPTGLVVGKWGVQIRAFNGLGPAAEWQPSWAFQPPPAQSLPGVGVLYVPPAPAPSLTAIVPAFEFGSYGEGPGEFLAPHNIAFGPGGIIAVSDAENNRIQLFHPNGTFALEVGSRGSGLGEFAGPHGLTFGPNGLLAVSDVGNHRVQVFRIQ